VNPGLHNVCQASLIRHPGHTVEMRDTWLDLTWVALGWLGMLDDRHTRALGDVWLEVTL
jgi:hypothetical protein